MRIHPQQLYKDGQPEPFNFISPEVLDRCRTRLTPWLQQQPLVKSNSFQQVLGMKFGAESTDKTLSLKDFNTEFVGRMPQSKSELCGVMTYFFRFLLALFQCKEWLRLREFWETHVYQFQQDQVNSVTFLNIVTNEMFKSTGMLFSDQSFLVKSTDAQFHELSNVFTGLYLEGKSVRDFYNYYATIMIAKLTESVSPTAPNATVKDNSSALTVSKKQRVDSPAVGKNDFPCFLNLFNNINKKIVCDKSACTFNHDKDVFEYPKSKIMNTVKAFLSSPKQKPLLSIDKAAFEASIEKAYVTELKGKNANTRNDIRILNSSK